MKKLVYGIMWGLHFADIVMKFEITALSWLISLPGGFGDNK
jgi:hypothetical protein